LIWNGRAGVGSHVRRYAHSVPSDLATRLRAHPEKNKLALVDIVRSLKPSALIGVSGQTGAFSEGVISSMAVLNSRPIIFALSNPTAMSECTAEEAYKWSKDAAIFASGSPFPEYHSAVHGRMVPRQANNCYIFPGVGLGVLQSQKHGTHAHGNPARVTDQSMLAAARALAALTDVNDLKSGSLFPSLSRTREVSASVAAAVMEVIADGKSMSAKIPFHGLNREATRAWVHSQMYYPHHHYSTLDQDQINDMLAKAHQEALTQGRVRHVQQVSSMEAHTVVLPRAVRRDEL